MRARNWRVVALIFVSFAHHDLAGFFFLTFISVFFSFRFPFNENVPGFTGRWGTLFTFPLTCLPLPLLMTTGISRNNKKKDSEPGTEAVSDAGIFLKIIFSWWDCGLGFTRWPLLIYRKARLFFFIRRRLFFGAFVFFVGVYWEKKPLKPGTDAGRGSE